MQGENLFSVYFSISAEANWVSLFITETCEEKPNAEVTSFRKNETINSFFRILQAPEM